MRALETAAQIRERFRGLISLFVRPTEIEVDERLVGVLREIKLEQAEVPLLLARTKFGILVADMMNCDVSVVHHATEPADGRQDLFMDAILPADVGMIAEEPDVVDYRGDSGRRVGKTAALHRVAGYFVVRRRK